VHVQVIDFLPAITIAVDHQIDIRSSAIPVVCGNLGGHCQHAAQRQFVVW
jgi:hypothetical protein